MITAKNYAAEAVASLRKTTIPALKKNGQVNDSAMVEGVCIAIEDSIHFALPDEGSIFDDGLKGIRGDFIRLPYPQITVEYFTDQENNHRPKGERVAAASKRLAIAREIFYKQDNSLDGFVPDSVQEKTDNNFLFIEVLGIYFLDSTNIWVPNIKSIMIPAGEWDKTESVQNWWGTKDDKGNKCVGTMRVVLSDMFNEFCKANGFEKTDLATSMDCVEQSAVLELIEALSCSNVYAETMKGTSPKEVKASMRRRKVPIWETKVLTIDTPKAVTGHRDGYTQSGRASPRQHLRMGHIRRLQNDKKIFVNSCVVGSLAQGSIHKDYAVR